MVDVANNSFETPGTETWLPSDWTITVVYSGGDIANFGVDTPVSVERFGRGWSTVEYVIAISGIKAPMDMVWVTKYQDNPNGIETFLYWRKYKRLTATNGAPAYFYYVLGSSYLPSEQFTSGWNNDDYFTSISGVSTPDDFQDWMPSPYKTEIIGGLPAIVGSHENGDFAIETFIDVLPKLVFIADPDTNSMSIPTVLLATNQKVTVTTTGVLPSGIYQNLAYYVILLTPTTFRLAKTPNGAPVTITDAGAGIHTIIGDPTEYWTTTL